jgi:molybdopterin-guanine dinucleotide biosynthesis adapter protein
VKAFGLVGRSGSGKTSLLVEILPRLIARGIRVSTLKHTHHNFDIDSSGKDSYRHRKSGALEVMLASSSRWVLMHENGNDKEPDLDELMAHMSNVDLLLVEGFKNQAFDKIEVYRPSVGKSPLFKQGLDVVALITDDLTADDLPDVPVLDINDVEAIVGFIVKHCDLMEEDR